ncbi:hypothetical protein CFE70_002693 [Pyrenophora teres f. teres 0-1]
MVSSTASSTPVVPTVQSSSTRADRQQQHICSIFIDPLHHLDLSSCNLRLQHYLYPSCADRSELQCPQSIIVDSVHHLDLSSCNLRLQHYLYPSCADCSELQCPQPIIIDALLDFHLQHCHSYPDQNYKPEQQHPSTSAQATSTPCTTSAASTPTPVQATQVYPPKATSTPCDETKPSATSAAPPNPSSDNSEPAQNYGKTEQGYTKRGGLIQRRKPIIAKSKRAILL